MKRALFLVLSLLAASCRGAPAPRDEMPAAHAYYVFATGSRGRYVPLLVSTSPLEELSSAARDSEVVLITTYERDSIWRLERGVPLAAADVSPGPRMLRLRDVEYDYQEIAPAEVLHLLEHPVGTISVHSTFSPGTDEVRDLIEAFGGSRAR